jgi:L-fuculose-phosphate aldolase
MIRVPKDLPQQLVDICQRMHARGLVAGTDGNVSVRFSRDHILATPTGMSKGSIGTADLVVCDLEGNQLQGQAKLTTEIKIHLAVYQQREDACAVVHAHPPHATAFAVARKHLDERLMPEAYIAVGKVALTPYGTPSTSELENSIRPAAAEHEAILLSNHGALTLGRDLLEAYHRMEALEQLAHITTLTHMLGSATPLTPEEMARLEAVRDVYGKVEDGAACWNCGPGGHKGTGANAAAKRTAQATGQTTAASAGGTTTGSNTKRKSSTTGYQSPAVHWPGNPPVRERTTATPASTSTSTDEDAIRSMAEKALRELRGE